MIHQAPTIFYRKKEHPESLIQICHLSWYNKGNDASIIMTEKDFICILMLVEYFLFSSYLG